MNELPLEEDWPEYFGLIRQIARSIVVNNPAVVSNDDLLQAGAVAVIVALQCYDPSQGSFNAYIKKCIKNAMLEQANSFNTVFTVNDKVRRQANMAARLRDKGKTNKEIMRELGIRKEVTLESLFALVDAKQDDLALLGQVMDQADFAFGNLTLLSEELNLADDESKFVELSLFGCSMKEIETTLELSTAQLYKIRSTVYKKFINWMK